MIALTGLIIRIKNAPRAVPIIEPNTGIKAVNPITTAPTAPNTEGLKFVVLNAEPANRYEGYIYLITEEWLNG